MSKNKVTTGIILWSLISAYIVFFGSISFFRYRYFDYGDMDLAAYSQMMWSIINGSLHSSVVGMNIFGHHAHFILLLIAPVYFFFQSPLTLLFLQTVSLALAAYPIFLIAREELNERIALAIVFAYLLYPALGYTNIYEFHVPVFATAFLSFMLYFFKRGDFGKFTLFMLLSLLCQENIPLIIIPVGIYALFIKRGLKWSVVPILSGAAWFWLMVGKVMPHLSNDTVNFFTLYSHLGNSLPEIAWSIISNPFEVAKVIITRQNMIYLVSLFMPVCFFPLFAPQILIILPLLIQHMLSMGGWEHTIYHHYTAEMLPIIFISTIYGIKRFLAIACIQKHLRQGVFILIMVIAVITVNTYLGPHTILVVKQMLFNKDIWDLQKQDFIKMIPGNAGVVATFEFLPKLTRRKGLYSFHHIVTGLYTLSDKAYRLPEEVEYALLDFNDTFTFDYPNPYFGTYSSFYEIGKSHINLSNFIRRDYWGVVDAVGSIVLLRKNYKSGYLLYQALDALPVISNTMQATADSELELIGYNAAGRKTPDKDRVKLTFFWRALKETGRDYGSFIDIVDENEDIKYRFIKPICYRIYPCHIWQIQKVIREDYTLLLPPGLGNNYSVRMGIFDYKDKKTYGFTSPYSGLIDRSGRASLKI